MKSKKKKGISLIVLVITIIVIVILAVAVILSLANNNPIENAREAKFRNDLKAIQEEVNMYTASQYAKSNGVYTPISISGDGMVDQFPSTKNYSEKVTIVNGEVYVIDNDKVTEQEKIWARQLGISTIIEYAKLEANVNCIIERNNFN